MFIYIDIDIYIYIFICIYIFAGVCIQGLHLCVKIMHCV